MAGKLWYALLAAGLVGLVRSIDVTIVELSEGQPIAETFAVQVCAGLFNRDVEGRPVYVIHDEFDSRWLEDAIGVSPDDYVMVPARDFLFDCLVSEKTNGRLRYDFLAQQTIVPNLVTIAAVLDAIPLEDSDPLSEGQPIVFDALQEGGPLGGAGATPIQATEFVFNAFANQTSGLAKMNPGWNTRSTPFRPELSGMPDLKLADFIVAKRIFNFFLNLGCINGTPEYAMHRRIAQSPIWPDPKTIIGYDDTFTVAGSLFEAETICTADRNMGQVASSGVANFAFWARAESIEAPLPQVDLGEQLVFDPAKNYVSLIVGDGDNIQFLRTTRSSWMKTRVESCLSGNSSSGGSPLPCFPLLWTVSPYILHSAPDWLKWYYSQAAATASDWFVLPPSGDLYAYPSLMSDADQAKFVEHTERDCELLSTSATVAWEFMGSWENAIDSYFPRYADRGVVTALFPVNVPFMIPIKEFRRDEDFKVIGDKTVLFKPREWRSAAGECGGDGAGATPAKFCLTAAEMAEELNTKPLGSVSHIYLTSDGGLSIEDVIEMVEFLAPHVQVVHHHDLAEAALQRSRILM